MFVLGSDHPAEPRNRSALVVALVGRGVGMNLRAAREGRDSPPHPSESRPRGGRRLAMGHAAGGQVSTPSALEKKLSLRDYGREALT